MMRQEEKKEVVNKQEGQTIPNVKLDVRKQHQVVGGSAINIEKK